MFTPQTTGGKGEPNIISLIFIYIHTLFGLCKYNITWSSRGYRGNSYLQIIQQWGIFLFFLHSIDTVV
jgi:hypothetical protein